MGRRGPTGKTFLEKPLEQQQYLLFSLRHGLKIQGVLLKALPMVGRGEIEGDGPDKTGDQMGANSLAPPVVERP